MADNKKKNNRPTQEEIVKGKIANALTSAAKNHIVATTDDLYDTNFSEYQDEINKSLDSGITEILDELQYVAKEDTLVSGITQIREDISEIELDTSDLAKEDTLVSGITQIREDISEIDIDTSDLAKEDTLVNAAQQADTKLNEIIGTQADTLGLISGQTSNILNTVNTQAQVINTNISTQAGEIISNNNQQTTTITSTVNQQAQSTNTIINNKTSDIINTVNAQAQSLTNDIANLDDNLDSGVTRLFEAINIIKEELQGQNSAITLTYLYDMLGDLSTLLDEINGEEMPVEFATDYARQGENSGATNTAILDAVQNIDFSTLAKEATLERVEGKVDEISLSSETLGILAESWQQMVTERNSIEGYTLAGIVPNGIGDIVINKGSITHIIDNKTEILNAGFTGNFNSLIYAEFTAATILNGESFIRNNHVIQTIKLNAFRGSIGRDFILLCNALKIIELKNASAIVGINAFYNLPLCEEIYLTNLNSLTSSSCFILCPRLILLEFGTNIQSNVVLTGWSPTEALLSNSQTLLTAEDIAAGFTSNLEKLLYNIREHIAANLPVAPLTVTFSAAVKAAILADQPTADAFTNKGWTIA